MSQRRPSATSAEFSKLLDLRPPRRLILTTVLLSILTTVVLVLTFPVTQGIDLAAADSTEVISASILGVDVAAAVLVVLAAWFAGIELRSGAIAESLVRARRRREVVIAKTNVIAVVSALTAVVVAIIVTALGTILAATVTAADWSAAVDLALDARTLRLAFGSALMPLVFSLLALFGAFCFRSTAGGVLTALAVIACSMVAGWLPAPLASMILPLLPLSAVHSLSGVAALGSPEHIGPIPASLVLATWIACTAAIASSRMEHQDY